MAKELKIDLLADTRDFQRGVQDAEKELDKVADALDDVARDGDSAARKVERSMDGIADAAGDAGKESSDRLERSFREIADDARKNGADAGDGLRKGLEDGGEAAGEFKREANSSATEAAASFRGEFQDIPELIQEVAANAFAGFGPLGAAAGIAAAVGIGAITAAFVTGGEQSEEMKQRIADLGDEFIETGGIGKRSLEGAVDLLKQMATATEDGEANLKDLSDIARRTGDDYKDLAESFLASGSDIGKEYAAAVDAMNAYERALSDVNQEDAAAFEAANKKYNAQREYVDILGKTKTEVDAAAEADRLYAAAGGPALAAKAEATQSYADEVVSALGDAGAEWEEFAKAEGGIDLEKYNAELESKAAAISQYQENIKTASGQLSAEALNYIMKLGPDAAPLLQAFIDAPLDQKERTAQNWATLGGTASSEFTDRLVTDLPSTIDGPEVKLSTNLEAFKATVRNGLSAGFNVGVNVVPRGTPVT